MNAACAHVRDIYTRRLLLRLPHVHDATALARLMRPEISARLASWPAQLTPGAAAVRLAEARTAAQHGAALPLVIVRRATGEMIGWIGAALAEGTPKRAILTYWLGLRHQGEGLMGEAAPAALSATFHHLAVEEVRAAVQVDNPVSRSVLLGLGMALQGLGPIWCAARAREELVEWWAVARPGHGVRLLPDAVAAGALRAPAEFARRAAPA